MNKSLAPLSVTISGDLFLYVRNLYTTEVVRCISSGQWRFGTNCSSITALPAYITSVAAVESFVNEHLLGRAARSLYRNSPLWGLEEEWIEKLELKRKLILIPPMLFNKPFPRTKNVFNDITSLISIRNDITHYKMYKPVGKYMKDLQNRKITFGSTRPEDYWVTQPWVEQLNCSEGIRWAYNTACKTLHTLLDLQDPGPGAYGFYKKENFPLISEDEVTSLFKYLDVDTSTDTPLQSADESVSAPKSSGSE